MNRRTFLKTVGYGGVALSSISVLEKMIIDNPFCAEFNCQFEYYNAVRVPRKCSDELKKQALEALYIDAKKIVPKNNYVEFRMSDRHDYGRHRVMSWYYSPFLPKK